MLRLIVASLATAVTTALPHFAMAQQIQRTAAPRESRLQAGTTSLYVREVGQGTPLIVLHGGPDFDHAYLLPDLDRLANGFRLVYEPRTPEPRTAEDERGLQRVPPSVFPRQELIRRLVVCDAHVGGVVVQPGLGAQRGDAEQHDLGQVGAVLES
jgi:hypothetical protein